MLFKMRDLIKHAEEHKYAIGYFESFNMDSMIATVNAAEKYDSPVIIGFGGQFIGSNKRRYKENVSNYGAAALEIARNASVPAAVLLNEADDIDMAYQALGAGFNAVMYVKPGEPLDDRVRITKELCRAAHSLDIDVEGEFDDLPNADISTGMQTEGTKTDVETAKRLVAETGVDALSVAIGNVHLLEGSHSTIDFQLLRGLREEIPVPLVLHGGTGVSDEDMKKAISLGISKVNVGTAIKRAYLNAIQDFIRGKDVSGIDPHVTIGWGGDEDLLSYCGEAINEKICNYIDLFGSRGKAEMILRSGRGEV
jgi:ketose-bisphosphate aldolase